MKEEQMFRQRSKQQLIKALPSGTTDWLRHLGNLTRVTLWSAKDARRFRRHYSPPANPGNQAQIDARLMFHAHALEKGLSHTDFRPGFGRVALGKLHRAFTDFHALKATTASPAYHNAVSVLLAYRSAHAAIDFDVSALMEPFNQWLGGVDSEPIGGVTQVRHSDKKENASKTFVELFQGRTSIREFSSDAIDPESVRRAVSLSRKSPSICNRQAVNVRHLTEKDQIETALDIQGGMRGYASPQSLLVVTADTSTLMGANERNQPFIDGGIFSMSLLLALESESLASCPLNAMFSSEQDMRLREAINIPDNEVFILFIAVGKFLPQVLAPKSFRYPLESVLIEC